MAIKIQYETIRDDLKVGDTVILNVKENILDSKNKLSTNYKIVKIETHRFIDEKETSGYTTIQIEAI